MSSFYDLLEKIRQKPSLYLFAPSVTNLQFFLCGYAFARHEQGIDLTDEEKEFEQFGGWMRSRFNVSGSVSWAKIILLYAVDERAGFEAFFQLLEAFIQEQRQATLKL